MPNLKSGASTALKLGGWLWCVGTAITAIALAKGGWLLPALAYGISAFLAAPPSWRLLGRHGITASRKTQVVAVVVPYLCGVVIASASNAHPFGDVRPAKDVSTAQAVVTAPAEGPATCEGIESSPRDFAVRKNGPLRERGDAQSGQVTMPFGVDQVVKPVSIDTTMPVREICRSGTWSYVAILELPSDIGKAKGWVPTANLRPVKTDERGKRIYGPADFEWDDGSLRYQKAILTVVNRVMAQNPKCDAFNSRSILMAKDSAGPLIKVACFGEPEQIVNFRPDDATNGRSFAPVEATTREDAMRRCEAAAREQTSHPSTADFSIWGARFSPRENGTSIYKTTFTAKNAFNLELSFRVECEFFGSDLTSVDIFEAAQ